MKRTVQPSKDERGFAVLMVFVLAAAIAISLYMELPRVTFESQRQRELLTVMRGHEYERAIQLYYRKLGRYPTKLEDLENTNNIRFLRAKYKDPLTGKDDWRLVHIGPGGMLTDSLVQKAQNPLGGDSKDSKDNKDQTTAQNATGQTPSTDPNAPAGPINFGKAQRPSDLMAQQQPPIGGSPGQGYPGQQPDPNQTDPGQQPYPGQTSTQPGQPGQPAYPGQPNYPGQPSYPGQPTQPGQPGQPGQPVYPGQPGYPTQPGQPVFPGQPGYPTQPGQPSPFPGQPGTPFQPGQPIYPGQPGYPTNPAVPGQPVYPGQPGYPTTTPTQPGQTPYNPNQPFNPNQPYPQTGTTGSASTPGGAQTGIPGAIANSIYGPGGRGAPSTSGAASNTSGTNGPGGLGIAGVASKAAGVGIILVNDKSKYKEWEFIYNFAQDQAKQVGAAVGAGGAGSNMPGSSANSGSGTAR